MPPKMTKKAKTPQPKKAKRKTKTGMAPVQTSRVNERVAGGPGGPGGGGGAGGGAGGGGLP